MITMQNINNINLIGELIRELKKLRNEMTPLAPLFDYLLEEFSKKNIKVIIPRRISVSLKFDGVINLEYFWCPVCGRIYRYDAALGRNFVCACGGRLVQAYIAAPHYITDVSSTHRIPSKEDIFHSVEKFVGIWCSNVKKIKRIVRINPERPVSSLVYACPDEARSCNFKSIINVGGKSIPICRYESGRDASLRGKAYVVVRPQRRSNSVMKIVPPSEALTKPFSITLYKQVGEDKVDVEFEHECMPGISSITFTKVRVYQLTLALLAGAPYASKGDRVPVVVRREDGVVEILGRKMETDGLIIKLDPEKVTEVSETLTAAMGFDESESTPTVICHTIAHLFLTTAPIVAGLSEHEFGEALRVDPDQEVYEVLIYDNSPGGIGGIKSLVEENGEIKMDYLALIARRVECPRSCRLACKACLFTPNCMWLNYSLNRFAIRFIVDPEKIAKYVV
jgi:hypothetical protein